ncbi:F0F1 ATP synthase subunit delta [Marinicella rhabdoformis]|uniref:F0F1 ATP synthase subunit delta n=1 Tax=Marinicella rhabdoformis TaxID=2580566 RepID=UPI0012AEC5BE|nr:F0F1 ATP synthase subunit delta [Marinicella rhabdoformis]
MNERVTLARPYAKAAYEFAKSASVVEQWSNDLSVAGGLTENDDILSFINQPNVLVDELVKLLCGEFATEEYTNLIRLMAANDRLSLLPQVAQLFHLYKEEDEASQTVDVYTAVEMTDAQQQALIAALSKKTGKKISINAHIDASLIGGARIVCGDLVIDGTLRGKVDRMKTKLTN